MVTFGLSAAPYMWSGPLSSHPVIWAYEQAADLISAKTPAKAPATSSRQDLRPSLTDIRQSFEDARWRIHPVPDPNFAHAKLPKEHNAGADIQDGSSVTELEAWSRFSKAAVVAHDGFEQEVRRTVPDSTSLQLSASKASTWHLRCL